MVTKQQQQACRASSPLPILPFHTCLSATNTYRVHRHSRRLLCYRYERVACMFYIRCVYGRDNERGDGEHREMESTALLR